MRRFVSASIMAMALSLALGACGEQEKVQECNALVTVINDGIDKVQTITTASADAGSAVTDLRALADEMDAVAKQAEQVQVTIPELEKLAEDYRSMATDIAAAARELAAAVDNVDSEKMKKAQERIASTVRREDPLVQEINRFCQTP